MSQNKLQRFAEMESLSNVIQVPFKVVLNKDFDIKGKWKTSHFKNNNPIVLELGCGKGEYTVGLAGKFPDKNFIGIDIKGNRMWVGAKSALHKNLSNVAFLRTRIELIGSFFDEGEIDEIWITFPDPQPKKRWVKKRLTSSVFLTKYRQFIVESGIVHLKTDSFPLHEYTKKLLEYNRLKIFVSTSDLYESAFTDEVFEIKTFYESGFIEKGEKITYLKFNIHSQNPIVEIPDEENT
jgi:tRNA (guanine-N7-)-methyltransferase